MVCPSFRHERYILKREGNAKRKPVLKKLFQAKRLATPEEHSDTGIANSYLGESYLS
jgi:hypothetical protein